MEDYWMKRNHEANTLNIILQHEKQLVNKRLLSRMALQYAGFYWISSPGKFLPAQESHTEPTEPGQYYTVAITDITCICNQIRNFIYYFL